LKELLITKPGKQKIIARYFFSMTCKGLFLVILFIICIGKNTYGQQSILLDAPAEEININPYCYIYKYNNRGIADYFAILNAPDSDFVRNTVIQEVNFDFDRSAGWSKFSIKNVSDTEKIIILKVQQARVDSVQLFVKKENGQIITYPLTGHFQTIGKRPYYSLHFANKIIVEANETLSCYLYTQRKYGRHAVVLSIHDEQDYRHYETKFTIYISIICGLIFLASLVGIVLCFFVYDKKYIYYSVYCISYIPLILSDSGFFHAFIQNSNHEVFNNINMITYYWIVGWHILFTVVLLNLQTHKKKWMYWLGISSGYLFCCFAVLLLFSIPENIRWSLSYLSYFVVFFMDGYIIYAIVINLVTKKNAVVYFYLAGFLITLIVASVLMLADLQVIEGINQKTDLFFITPFFEILCMVIGLGIHFSENVKQKLRTQQQLNETQREVLNIQENERSRIAEDLHDDVGNSLAALKNIVIHNKESYNIEHEIDKVLHDIRNISHDLMPVDFDKNKLPDIISQTVRKFANHPAIRFEYTETGDPVKLNPVTELVIYRIVNELISNIIKHSNANEAMVQLIYQTTSLVLMAEDNGTGIHNKNNTLAKGIGLKNVKHRSRYIQANLNIESDAKGTLIILEIPYANNR
jgi:signal transduction histidine kinase